MLDADALVVDQKAIAGQLIADQVEWDKLEPDSNTAEELATAAIVVMQAQIKAGNGEALKAALVDANATELADAVTQLIEAAP